MGRTPPVSRRTRGALAAELAGTMLRGAFAGVPPVAFARHLADTEAGASDRGSPRFRFVREWLSRRDWPAEEEERGEASAGEENAWRLADALADAGVCAAPAAPAPPSPAARAPGKRKRVEV